MAMNERGEKPDDLTGYAVQAEATEDALFGDVVGQDDLNRSTPIRPLPERPQGQFAPPGQNSGRKGAAPAAQKGEGGGNRPPLQEAPQPQGTSNVSRGRPILLLFTAILEVLWCMTGCGPAPVAAEAVDLDPEGWLATDTAVMEFGSTIPIGTTFSSECGTSGLPLQPVPLRPAGIPEWPDPDRHAGVSARGPPDGRWYGEGSRWIDQRIGYKRGVAFPLEGDYTLRVVHAMPTRCPGWPSCVLLGTGPP